MSGLLTAIDIYCERLALGLLAEPLNAITNAAFFIAAYALWRHYRTSRVREPGILLLIALIAIIGVGSSLFHTFANRLTALMDVISIGIFLCTYIWVFAARVASAGVIWRVICLGAFVGLGVATGFLPEQYQFNGSVSYAPAFIAMMAIIAFSATRRLQTRMLWAGLALFSLSLTFRTLDKTWCELLPFGTHFMWHMLNGVTLYIYVRWLMETSARMQTKC